jgi:hypothetical protein
MIQTPRRRALSFIGPLAAFSVLPAAAHLARGKDEGFGDGRQTE